MLISITRRSLRQHDLDQVIRVERGSLLSVPHRGTPRSIVGYNYTRILPSVNSKTLPFPADSSRINERGVATLPSFAVRAD
jgi:hypothetical protein